MSVRKKSRFSEFKLYSANDDSAVLVLTHPCTIYFNGSIDILVVFGAVEVLGYTLFPGDSKTLFSPKGSSLLGITTIHETEENEVDEVLLHNVSKMIEDHFIVFDCVFNNSVLLLKRNKCQEHVDILQKCISFKLYPSIKECTLDIEKCLNCHLETEETNYKHFVKGGNWEELIASIFETDCANNLKVVVCGGKGVGKSTFLRYFVNRTLSEEDSVVVLDLDPGQSEFTVMGCISAVVVSEPLLGPNFTHLKTPIRCLYLGYISVTNNLNLYVSYVQNIIDYCKADEKLSKMTWIVNTMGFTKGLGVELISHTIRCTSPTDVIQINSMKNVCNFPEKLTPTFVKQCTELLPHIKLTMDYNLSELSSVCESPTTHNTSASWGLSSSMKREIVVLSYFLQMIGPGDEYFTDVVPYVIKGSDIKLEICDKQFSHKQILNIMNGNLVALCSMDSQDVTHCIGYGIVRGIDVESDELYINTPLDMNALSSVKIVKYSREIQIPESIIKKQVNYIEDHIPYLELLDSSCNNYHLQKTMRRTCAPRSLREDNI